MTVNFLLPKFLKLFYKKEVIKRHFITELTDFNDKFSLSFDYEYRAMTFLTKKEVTILLKKSVIYA